MRVPQRLEPLVEQGVIEEVLRPLLSGKEADVWLVRAGDELRVAKVYKEASNRSFKHRADYTEGRKVRNTRTQRAMSKRSKFGREQVEEAWRTAEVDAIHQLAAANVKVPEPFDFIEGVLVMELVAGPDGGPAPRLADMRMERDDAIALFKVLLQEVVKMLCAGVVHGDLSDFNVLLGVDGPVIIDFPQWTDPGSNNNAKALLLRDVANLQSFLARWAPDLKKKGYAAEMWGLYEDGKLKPDTRLTGKKPKEKPKADTASLLDEIEAIEREVRARRERLGLPPPGPARKPVPPPSGRRAGPSPISADASKGSQDSKRKSKSKGRSGGDRAPSNDRRERGPRGDRGPRSDRGRRDEPRPSSQTRLPTPPANDDFDLDAFLLVED